MRSNTHMISLKLLLKCMLSVVGDDGEMLVSQFCFDNLGHKTIAM